MVQRIKKFLIVGFSGVFVNMISIVVLVELLGMDSPLLKNIANFIAIEISILNNFTFNRLWTWEDIPKRRGRGLIAQFISFNLASYLGIVLRTISFAVLEMYDVNYMINVGIGIIMATAVNFVMYDKFVFKNKEQKKENTDYTD